MGRYANLAGFKPDSEPEDKAIVEEKSTPLPVKSTDARLPGINTPLYQSTIIPTFEETKGLNAIAVIHKAMREAPTAPASYRLSATEKKRLEVVLFELKMRAMQSPDAREIRSNENEIMRVALNWLLNDYQAKSGDSILVKTLLSLRS